jgi:hypothetical protein
VASNSSDILEHNKYRRGTKYEVTWPTLSEFTVQPRRIDLIQKQYFHDVVILEFSRTSWLWFDTIKTGIPVQFTWTQENLTRTWIGHVSSISKDENSARENVMRIHCVSATYPLKQRTTRVFRNTTIPNAVEAIVKEFGFKFVGTNHPRVFSQLNISGHSYWEWIQEQAKKIGYGLIIDGLNFIFKPLDELISLGFSSAPILSMGASSTVPANQQYLDRTLDNIRVVNGEHVENVSELRMTKTVGGVDPVTSKSFISTTSPSDLGIKVRSAVGDVLFDDYKTDVVANGSSAVTFASEGAAQLARLSLPAIIKGQGDPRIRPFGPVLIQGTGLSTDGFWIVEEVTHMLHQVGDYTLKARIVTDGMGDSSTHPFRQRDTSLVGTVNLTEALKNGGKQLQNFDKKDVTIRPASAILSSKNQGFKRTPTSWTIKKGR